MRNIFREKKSKIVILLFSMLMLCTAGSALLFFSLRRVEMPASQPSAPTEATVETDASYFPTSDSLASAPSDSLPEETLEESFAEEEAFREYDLRLISLGDNLLHMGIVRTGNQPDGTRNYDFLFENISDYLKAGDIKIINQETILGGNELGFSGFPKFNSPTEVGDAIANAGFNVVLHASNHAADQGITGIRNCLAFWEQYSDVLPVGIQEDPEDSSIPLLSIGDKTFAILNYTYSPNLETVPFEIRGHLKLLCAMNETTGALDFTTLNPDVLSDITRAAELADIVIVCPHWGTEYSSTPSTYQKKWALQMTEAGADVIIGTHPHVPQPVEWITAENGNTALCYYSLGNYVSTQKQKLTMLEAMAAVTFHVNEEGIQIDPDRTGVIPLVCHYTSGPVRLEGVYLLENYTEDQARNHGIWSYGPVALHLDYLQEKSRELFGSFALDSTAFLSAVQQ